MMCVGVEPGAARPHPANERDRGQPAGSAAGSRDAAGHLRRGRRSVDRGVRGVEEPGHVLRRRGRRQPAALIRLVPDRPAMDERVALGRRAGERREVGPADRHHVRAFAAVGPLGRSVERDDRIDPGAVELFEDGVRGGPVERVLRLLDRIPAHGHADDVEPEPLQRCDALLDRAGAVPEPGIVLDAVGDGRARERTRGGYRRHEDRSKERAQSMHQPVVPATGATETVMALHRVRPWPSAGSSLRTAARSPLASSGPASGSGSSRSPSPPPTTAAPTTRAARTRRSRSTRISTPPSRFARRSRPVPTPSIPGYGFLAENADFAEAVIAAGLTWVGPSPDALRLGGDKLAAKRIAREAGVPTVPQGSADEIGFPLVVKAAAGGGGRGMRVVRSAGELDEALAAAAARGRGGFRRRDCFLRAVSRAASPRRGAAPRARRRRRCARRAGLLDPATPSEARSRSRPRRPRPDGLADGSPPAPSRSRRRSATRAPARPSSSSTAPTSTSSSSTAGSRSSTRSPRR